MEEVHDAGLAKAIGVSNFRCVTYRRRLRTECAAVCALRASMFL